MTRDKIFQNIQVAIKNTFPDVDLNTVNITTHLWDDLRADSMDSIALLMELEDQFGEPLPMEKVSGIENVGQILDFIDERLNFAQHLKHTGF